tara:strand:- start:30 stop:578 length:549 start_codon:yes stop_codon:yes gene_type:complete
MPISINGSGTVSGISTGGISDAKAVADAAMPAGTILQVKQAVKTDTFTSSVNADITGLSVNITPSSSSNKIYIIAAVNAMANNVGCTYKINGTANGDIGMGAADGSRTRGNVGDLYEAYNSPFVTHTSCFLDSPNTTSQQTYKVVAVSASGNTVKVNRGNTDTDGSAKIRGASSITVMEVAG